MADLNKKKDEFRHWLRQDFFKDFLTIFKGKLKE